LTGPVKEPNTFDWTLALPVRKKTVDERGADSKKPLELSPRLQQILLNEEYIYLGRSHENDIVLSPKSVSRLHSCIYTRDGKWFVVDLGSANGTLVNGTLLRESQVASVQGMNKISFGPDAEFVFVLPEDITTLGEALANALKTADTSDKIELPDAASLTKMKGQTEPRKTAKLASSQTDEFPVGVGVATNNDLASPVAKTGEDEKLELALNAIEAMFSIVHQVVVTISLKDQTITLYEASDPVCQPPKSLRESIWALRGILRSLKVSMSTGDRRLVEIFSQGS
jgi:pSer/pThr/pTyr-binding forkhead associated (FHA) protein